jgi:hypothetical protein
VTPEGDPVYGKGVPLGGHCVLKRCSRRRTLCLENVAA